MHSTDSKQAELKSNMLNGICYVYSFPAYTCRIHSYFQIVGSDEDKTIRASRKSLEGRKLPRTEGHARAKKLNPAHALRAAPLLALMIGHLPFKLYTCNRLFDNSNIMYLIGLSISRKLLDIQKRWVIPYKLLSNDALTTRALAELSFARTPYSGHSEV
jgi:hypothetical protein